MLVQCAFIAIRYSPCLLASIIVSNPNTVRIRRTSLLPENFSRRSSTRSSMTGCSQGFLNFALKGLQLIIRAVILPIDRYKQGIYMEAEEYFKRGIQRCEDGDYDGAISDYTEAVQAKRGG